MKKTIKGLMVMSAIVSSFVTAQVVAAETIEGIVQRFIPCTAGECEYMEIEVCTAEPKGNSDNGNIFIECDGTLATITGLRTTDYWNNYIVDEVTVGVDYPAVDDYVTIEAILQTCGNYFAITMEVCEIDDHDNFLTCEYIELHDVDEVF